MATRREITTLHGGLASVFAIAFSPDGRQLAASLLEGGGEASAGRIKVWDLTTGRALVSFSGTVGGTFALAFTPDGERLASTGNLHRDVTLWDARVGRELLSLRIHDVEQVGVRGKDSRLAFSPDGTRLALLGLGGVTIWEAPHSPESLRLSAQVSIWGLAHSPDGRRLAVAENKTAVSIRDSATGRLLLTLPQPDPTHESSLVDVRFSPDGRRLAAAVATRSTGEVTIWDALSGRFEGRLAGHSGHVINVVFSPDGKRLASASHDKTAKIWDPATHQPILTLAGHTDRVNGVAFSPDGKRLVTACRDGTLKLWDAADGRELATFRSHKGSIVTLAFSPDGRYLAAGGGRRSDQPEGPPGEVKVWDVIAGRERLHLPGLTHFIHCVAYAPDGLSFATAGEDRIVRLWDAADGQGLSIMRGHHDTIKRVSFNPDGHWLASSGEDRTVRVWALPPARDAVHIKTRRTRFPQP